MMETCQAHDCKQQAVHDVFASCEITDFEAGPWCSFGMPLRLCGQHSNELYLQVKGVSLVLRDGAWDEEK